ncbi:glycosyltransferase family 29 protein, partial [Vibrio cholerae]|nr:glycosyltransferase family 29 protein [Vibrio cholerae]
AKKKLDHLWVYFPWNRLVILSYCDYYEAASDFDSAIRLLDKAIGRDKYFKFFHRRALVSRKSGRLNDSILDDYMSAIKVSDEKNIKVDYIRTIWAIKGMCPLLISQCDNLYQLKDKLTANELMLLASIDCDAGRISLAKRKAYEALKKDSEIFSKYQSLPVISLLYKFDENFSAFHIQDSIYDYILSGQDSFIDLIRGSNNSYAIVGNGPSEIDSKNGKEIDAKSIVVRFNAFDVSYPLSIDYGSKTDIWVKAGNYIDLPRRNISKFKCVVASGYNNVYRSTMGIDDYFDLYQNKIPTSLIPNRIYEELISRLGAMPSAGLAILYWIYKEIGPIPKGSVFGFSFGNQKSNSSQHYFLNTKSKSHYNHNWSKEGEVLREIVVDE